MCSAGAHLKLGRGQPTACNNPCINLPADNLPAWGCWKAAESNFRFRCYRTPIPWAQIWLPELFLTRMRGTAVAFCFNAPRWISAAGPLIAGTLIVEMGGFGPAATIVGLFFIVGVIAARFLPETNGLPLPDTLDTSMPLPEVAPSGTA